ncbi:hypothetical protein PHLCEN_2v11538 [Hermanssonia centrifuga]|uniref:Uncharacterized protein n=1 Tax=Hermanssonia centrifuga TaxID=98765 RepID=A0A2R6NJH9_9APHY|nr:hypothetical protein PHLCEN_2v11538 [Hermanssonia centrifuga]
MSSSSSDEDRNENAISFHGSKKRRVQRACDICRRKKDTDLTQELGLPFDKETWLAQGVDKLDSPCPPRRAALPAVQPLPLDKTDDPDHSDEELVGRHTLEHHIKKMTVDPGQPRFFGKSSTIMFVQSAIDLKHGINKNDEVNNKIGIDKLPSKRPEFWKPHPVSHFDVTLDLVC